MIDYEQKWIDNRDYFYRKANEIMCKGATDCSMLNEIGMVAIFTGLCHEDYDGKNTIFLFDDEDTMNFCIPSNTNLPYTWKYQLSDTCGMMLNNFKTKTLVLVY